MEADPVKIAESFERLDLIQQAFVRTGDAESVNGKLIREWIIAYYRRVPKPTVAEFAAEIRGMIAELDRRDAEEMAAKFQRLAANAYRDPSEIPN